MIHLLKAEYTIDEHESFVDSVCKPLCNELIIIEDIDIPHCLVEHEGICPSCKAAALANPRFYLRIHGRPLVPVEAP